MEEAFIKTSAPQNTTMTAPEPAITGGRVARQAPGGASTICFGDDTAKVETVSSNAFAQGADQNCGNVITDRPTTTGVRHAPGGASTICFGDDTANGNTVSSNAFAQGADQNCGNVITDRPTTGGVRHAPGGASTIILGGDDPAEAFVRRTAPQNIHMPEQEVVKATGGKSTIVLGGYVPFEQAVEGAFVQTPAPQNTHMTVPAVMIAES